jgi:hypothetical protein
MCSYILLTNDLDTLRTETHVIGLSKLKEMGYFYCIKFHSCSISLPQNALHVVSEISVIDSVYVFSLYMFRDLLSVHP